MKVTNPSQKIKYKQRNTEIESVNRICGERNISVL